MRSLPLAAHCVAWSELGYAAWTANPWYAALGIGLLCGRRIARTIALFVFWLVAACSVLGVVGAALSLAEPTAVSALLLGAFSLGQALLLERDDVQAAYLPPPSREFDIRMVWAVARKRGEPPS